MNDDIVVQKILTLLENNTAFIGYALNGGIGTKINVRNTETGKTIQALSINVDSTGEVLVVKDSEDNQYKAVTFKIAEKVSERIIQIRKTKPIDDKKTIEYTDSDIEVFYLFVKLIDTGSPVTSQLTSTWIRKGSSCTQFVGAYERCNYAARQTISGTSYTGLPYIPYSTLNECLNDDLGRDAKTPHGTKDASGANAGWRYYSTQVSAANEASILAALTSHDANSGTNMRKLFGYGSIIECSGAMNLQGWEAAYNSQTGQHYIHCEFSYFPGYTVDCTPAMQAAGYCDSRGFISSKAPLLGQESPGMPSVGGVDNSWGHIYGWKDLSYEFMYKRHFGQLYLNGSTAPGSFYILEVNEDQVPSQLPSGYFPWTPGCPGNAPNGGPYDGSGGNRFPDGVAPISKRDMKLSTHKAEIWLGSSKRTEAIKLYELGVSDLFSGMYNSLIIKSIETRVDQYKRLNLSTPNTEEEVAQSQVFYQNRDKNRWDLLIDPKVWVYVMNNIPNIQYGVSWDDYSDYYSMAIVSSLQTGIAGLYNRTINLSVIDKSTQVIHLKLGLTPQNALSDTDCKGTTNSFNYGGTPANTFITSQSWKYQKTITIKVKNWQIQSITNGLDLTDINDFWNRDYISRKYLTSFGGRSDLTNTGGNQSNRDQRGVPSNNILRPNSDVDISNLLEGNNFEQWNYSVAGITAYRSSSPPHFFINSTRLVGRDTFADNYKRVGLSTVSWWELWNKAMYSQKNKRLSSIVGFEKNYYQILGCFGVDPNLDISVNPTIQNGFFSSDYVSYMTSRPKKYLPSVMKSVRGGTILGNYYNHLKSRQAILSATGLNFYFSDWSPRWSLDSTFSFGTSGFPSILPPSSYYSILGGTDLTTNQFMYSLWYYSGLKVSTGTRIYFNQFFNYMWAQLVYDGELKVDVDSYKDVEFNLYSPLNKQIKYVPSSYEANSEYSFITNTPTTSQSVDTVLSPGVLDINKQVPIKKPTNVELDPNMSFLVYMYPFCTVTKKTKVV